MSVCPSLAASRSKMPEIVSSNEDTAIWPTMRALRSRRGDAAELILPRVVSTTLSFVACSDGATPNSECRRDRCDKREGKHAHIRMERHRTDECNEIGRQRGEERTYPDVDRDPRDREPERDRRKGEHDAFRNQLSNETSARRAEGESRSQLALARQPTREKRVRDVRAGQHENERKREGKRRERQV